MTGIGVMTSGCFSSTSFTNQNIRTNGIQARRIVARREVKTMKCMNLQQVKPHRTFGALLPKKYKRRLKATSAAYYDQSSLDTDSVLWALVMASTCCSATFSLAFRLVYKFLAQKKPSGRMSRNYTREAVPLWLSVKK